MPVTTKPAFASPVSIAELGIRIHDPIQHLQHCHEQIERSLSIVHNAVASLKSTEPVLRAEAATALDYELALLHLLAKLHTQDEEQSFFPRLRRTLKDSDGLGELMQFCESQHREGEAIFEQLALCVRNLASSRGPSADNQISRLEDLVGQLTNHYRPHIDLENERLLGQASHYLNALDLDEMTQEMRVRFRT